jgi:hypothetical protein
MIYPIRSLFLGYSDHPRQPGCVMPIQVDDISTLSSIWFSILAAFQIPQLSCTCISSSVVIGSVQGSKKRSLCPVERLLFLSNPLDNSLQRHLLVTSRERPPDPTSHPCTTRLHVHQKLCRFHPLQFLHQIRPALFPQKILATFSIDVRSRRLVRSHVDRL